MQPILGWLSSALRTPHFEVMCWTLQAEIPPDTFCMHVQDMNGAICTAGMMAEAEVSRGMPLLNPTSSPQPRVTLDCSTLISGPEQNSVVCNPLSVKTKFCLTVNFCLLGMTDDIPHIPPGWCLLFSLWAFYGPYALLTSVFTTREGVLNLFVNAEVYP